MLNRQTLKNRIARLPRATSTTTLRFAAVLSIAMLAAAGFAHADQQGAESEKKQDRIYNIGGEVIAPHLLAKVEPKYTEEARAAKIEGAVLLSVVVGTDGLAHQINVVSTPDAGLGTKAVEAVQQWTFQPATLKGEPVPVKAQIEVNFKLL
jgi:TonB family protein